MSLAALRQAAEAQAEEERQEELRRRYNRKQAQAAKEAAGLDGEKGQPSSQKASPLGSRKPAPGADGENQPESAKRPEAEGLDEDDEEIYSSEPPPLDNEKIRRFTHAGKQQITSLIEDRYLRPQ